MKPLALCPHPRPVPPTTLSTPSPPTNNSTMKVERHQLCEMGAHEDRSGVLGALGTISEPLNHTHRDPVAEANDNAR